MSINVYKIYRRVNVKSILFDLDGTLVNSSPGIKAAFNYAFEKLQLPSQTDKQLSTFIGPPLEVTFGNYFDQTDDINHAIKTFRDYYGTKGIHQVSLYEGISDVLEELNHLNYSLFVTTSKHQPMARQMLTDLGIISYFEKVYGSTPQHFHKADVIKACLTEQKIQAHEAVIVGDTKFDMIGGKKTGVRRLGVTWGFGSLESLKEHGAECICYQPEDLKKALSSL